MRTRSTTGTISRKCYRYTGRDIARNNSFSECSQETVEQMQELGPQIATHKTIEQMQKLTKETEKRLEQEREAERIADNFRRRRREAELARIEEEKAELAQIEKKGEKEKTKGKTDEEKKAAKRKKSLTPPSLGQATTAAKNKIQRFANQSRAVAAAGTFALAEKLTPTSGVHKSREPIPSPLSGLEIGDFLDSDSGDSDFDGTSARNTLGEKKKTKEKK